MPIKPQKRAVDEKLRQRLKKLRTTYRLTQRELAPYFGRAASAVSMAEHGTPTPLPTIAHFHKILDGLEGHLGKGGHLKDFPVPHYDRRASPLKGKKLGPRKESAGRRSPEVSIRKDVNGKISLVEAVKPRIQQTGDGLDELLAENLAMLIRLYTRAMR